MTPRRTSHRTAAIAAVIAAAALSVAALATGPGVVPAGAQTPSLAVNPVVLPAGQASTVSVFGSSYLVPPHAPDRNVFGGVYVMFGWVAPGTTWGPSNRNGVDSNGQFGITYSYAGASRSADTRDDGTGHNRFVSFTAGGVSGESTDFHMTMDPAYPDNSRGNWATTITIPGSVYQWVDPATGATHTVDCTVVQCGIYTIGAHGVASATNERFVPVTFTNGGGGPVPTAPPVVNPGGSTGTTPPGGGQPSATNPPTVGGSSTSRGTPKPTTKATTATTTPGTAAPVETVPVETTTTVPETTTSSTVPPDSTTTTRARRVAGDTDSASGRVIVLEGDDDGGTGAWVWGAAVGTPLLAAGGFVLWRRRPTGA